MFQGTGSGVGKSILVAALCRLLKKRGINVCPFKAQNMALNSFVTADGKEMGRAQVFQAEACGLLPDVRMNPILLKPSSDAKSQVIVMGEPLSHLGAKDYYRRNKEHWEVVKEAYDSLSKEYEVIVIEGAGSPAEINLQDTDIVNMKMADYAKAGVIIVGDIDKGGVFASLKGTYDLIQDRYKRLIKGFLINKFRGDVNLLMPGVDMFMKIVPVPVLGILPWIIDLKIDEEDGVFLGNIESFSKNENALKILIAKLPRISNFTDFLPLSLEEDVELIVSDNPRLIAKSNLVIIPGTKATTADLEFLKSKGWKEALLNFSLKGGFILGICGGYQMLGQIISDPKGSDGVVGTVNGFGLLPINTKMAHKKTLKQKELSLEIKEFSTSPLAVKGYEIHMGKSSFLKESDVESLLLGKKIGPEIGLFDRKKKVFGTYLHGIFDNDEFRLSFLNFLRRQNGINEKSSGINYRRMRNEQFDLLSSWFEKNCDMNLIYSILNL